MARPTKKRRICGRPKYCSFSAGSYEQNQERVVMSLDEFECIRLIDYEGITQEECAEQINMDRTSVTLMYAKARKKLAECLVTGKELRIEGGNYEFCPGNLECCRRRMTAGNRCLGRMNEEWRKQKMVIAVTYENGQVFQHFGHSEYFKIYEVEDGKIVKSEVYDTNGQGHGALAGFLKNYSVNVLICGGIGGGARTALAQQGIELYPGVSGSADEAVKALIEGNLLYDPDTVCNHHGEGHEHTCGEHGCGSH